jgi:hypothetical protein
MAPRGRPQATETPRFAPVNTAAYPATSSAPPLQQAAMTTNPSFYADIARRIRAAAPEVQEVLLFGSHARGEARPDSDVDLVLLVADLADRRDILLRARKSLRGMGLGFDLLLLTPSQWTDAGRTGGWLAAQMARDAVRLDVAA